MQHKIMRALNDDEMIEFLNDIRGPKTSTMNGNSALTPNNEYKYDDYKSQLQT